jgi:hypothetical protein
MERIKERTSLISKHNLWRNHSLFRFEAQNIYFKQEVPILTKWDFYLTTSRNQTLIRI